MVSPDDDGLPAERPVHIWLENSWPALAGQTVHALYLVFWYLAGVLFILVLVYRARRRPTRPDILVGAGLGAFSVCGQTSMGLALANGMPGNVVFPVALGGGLFVVVVAAILVFKERIGPAGMAGISLGIISIALLSLN